MRISLFSPTALSLVLLTLGGGCLLAFAAIGSTIDEHGFLHEPFGLLPIGGLLIVCGGVAAIVAAIRAVRRKRGTRG